MLEYEEGQVLLTSKTPFASLIPTGTDLAFWSSYCIDFEWFREQLQSIDRTASLWLCLDYDQKAESHGVERVQTQGGRRVTIVKPKFPPYMTYGVMHAKLILYRTANFLRVIVSSANLMPHDYDEGPIQNILYVQDFRSIRVYDHTKMSHLKWDFRDDLQQFLSFLGAKEIANLFQQYDYSQTEHVRLVYSIPGNFPYNEKTCGMHMLSSAYSHFSLYHLFRKDQDHTNGRVTVQGSSLGKLSKEWLWDFYKAVSRHLPKEGHFKEVPNLSIVFPTESFAKSYGMDEFGTIFCRSDDWFNSYSDDVKGLFCKCASLSPLHTKMIIHDEIYYLGSHNFTAAAWGRRTKNREKLIVNNYELGVVIHGREIPVPFKMPAERYSHEDRPWMQDLYFDQF